MKCDGNNKIQHLPGTDDDNRTWCNSDSHGLGGGVLMRYFSAFTGAGGFDLGMPGGWECIGMSEIDKYADMVLKFRFRDVENYGDIEKIRYSELPDFEVLIGGSPCQDVSLAGKREGLSGSRSRLFYSYVEILKAKKPGYFIFENVKGLLSSNARWDFAEVVYQFSEAGYDVWWQVLDAVDFGIPQHRERVFILGSAGGSGFREIFFERKDKKKNTKLQGQQANTITRRYKQSEATGTYIVENQFNAQIENLHFTRSQPNRVYGTNGVAPTLHRNTGGQQVVKIGIPVRQADGRSENANRRRFKEPDEPGFTLQSSQRHGVMFEDMRIRYLTPLECERLMGWPDNWTKYGVNKEGKTVELSDNARYNLIGNGVVPKIIRQLVCRFLSAGGVE